MKDNSTKNLYVAPRTDAIYFTPQTLLEGSIDSTGTEDLVIGDQYDDWA